MCRVPAELRAPGKVGLRTHLLLPLRQGSVTREYEMPHVPERHQSGVPRGPWGSLGRGGGGAEKANGGSPGGCRKEGGQEFEDQVFITTRCLGYKGQRLRLRVVENVKKVGDTTLYYNYQFLRAQPLSRYLKARKIKAMPVILL